jgi:hypothetical protein
MHARNEGVELMFIHALSENTAMLKIARNAGATLERAGSETEAYLRLPPATLDSRVSELLEEQLAQTDYRLKKQAKSFLGLPGQRAGNPPRRRSARGKSAAERPRPGPGAARAAIRYPMVPPLRLTAVSDPHPARATRTREADKRTFLQKVAEFIHPGPDSTAELIETLADAEDNDIIGPSRA